MYSRCFLIRNTESETKAWQSIEGCAFKAQMKKAAGSWSNQFPTVPLSKSWHLFKGKPPFWGGERRGREEQEGDKSSKADERIQPLRKICTCLSPFEERWQYQNLKMAKHLQLLFLQKKNKIGNFLWNKEALHSVVPESHIRLPNDSKDQANQGRGKQTN